MLGGCTEQTLHVTARKFTCHGTGSAKGGGFGAESAPNVRKYVEAAAAVAVVVLCWWEAECAFFLFYPTTFVLKILWHQIRCIYLQHYDANTNIVPSITKQDPDIHHCQ